MWVVNADDETVLRIDPKTKRVVKTIGGLGKDLTSIAFGSGSVWVAGGNDGTVVRIDPKQNAAEAPVDLGSSSKVLPQPVFLVATGAGGVWVTRGNRLLRIDPRTNAVTMNVTADRTTGLAAKPAVSGRRGWTSVCCGSTHELPVTASATSRSRRASR